MTDPNDPILQRLDNLEAQNISLRKKLNSIEILLWVLLTIGVIFAIALLGIIGWGLAGVLSIILCFRIADIFDKQFQNSAQSASDAYFNHPKTQDRAKS
ncbi:hypothetical protein JD969_09490 [Planctomycetota bacterium]|nr:hypothetical protein JD969_09490 [Planctomycetota bacterium]